ncbi:MAG: hypothetical protein KKH11_02575, partial [Candidatus Omnitrophica bacterium]|nr:hypothetical protein [Candidatus Omnitrophota bacterium]
TFTYLESQGVFYLYLYFYLFFYIYGGMKMTLSFKVDPQLKDALLKLADKENRTLSNYVVTALMKHLESHGIDWREETPKK